jgi:hypothetical protein
LIHSGFIANLSDVKTDKIGNFSLDKKFELAILEGEWSRFININNCCYWRQDEEIITEMEKMDFTIPSDAHYREDLILLKMGLLEKSQEAKVFLEEIQRKDKILRNKK